MGARGVAVGVVVLGVLVAGAAFADTEMRDRAEQRIASDVEAAVPGLSEPPEVSIREWPFLTQVLAGELEDVRVATPGVTVQGIAVEDIRVRLQGVSTDRPTTARDAGMTAFVPLAGIRAALPVDADLAIRDGLLVTSTEVAGLPLEVAFSPRPDGRAIAVDVRTLRLSGATVTVDDLPSGLAERLQGIRVPLEGLPPGMTLSELTIEPDGARVAAVGSDVVLEATAAP